MTISRKSQRSHREWMEKVDRLRDQLTTKDRQIAELRWELDHLIEMYSHWFRREPLHGSCKDCGLPQDHKIHL